MTVWKFVLSPYTQSIYMPDGAQVLSVGAQHQKVCVWALVNPNNPVVPRRFVLAVTGHDVPGHGRFLGTVILEGGGLVFHIWEAPAT